MAKRSSTGMILSIIALSIIVGSAWVTHWVWLQVDRSPANDAPPLDEQEFSEVVEEILFCGSDRCGGKSDLTVERERAIETARGGVREEPEEVVRWEPPPRSPEAVRVEQEACVGGIIVSLIPCMSPRQARLLNPVDPGAASLEVLSRVRFPDGSGD